MSGNMIVNVRSAQRWGFRCYCCQPPPGRARKIERRVLKKREREILRAEIEAQIDEEPR